MNEVIFATRADVVVLDPLDLGALGHADTLAGTFGCAEYNLDGPDFFQVLETVESLLCLFFGSVSVSAHDWLDAVVVSSDFYGFSLPM